MKNDGAITLKKSFSELKPSEQAAALKECFGSKGRRARNRDIVTAEHGLSSRTASRLLRLNYLIPEFKELLDDGKLALMAAVEISFLAEAEQADIWKLMNRQGLRLKPKAAAELRKHGGELTEERIADIMDALSVDRISGNEGISIKLPEPVCEKYFAGMETAQMAAEVEQALDVWFSGKGAAYVQS